MEPTSKNGSDEPRVNLTIDLPPNAVGLIPGGFVLDVVHI
jgi:hypothetical protein